MKFWQKAFVCVIALFLLGFDIMGYILAERSYALNRDYALAAAETEYNVIKKSLSESVRLSKNNFAELNVAADEISKGNYDKRVEIKSRDEIDEFADSFNRMANHVGEHIAELSRMTQSKQNFIDNLTHEIRTPITAIVGYGELLQYANCTDDERQSAIRHIIGQGKRVQNMSFKLLDLSHTGNADIQLSPVKLEDVLANALATEQENLTLKNINVSVETQPITICGVSVEISDHGKGIEAEELSRITEPFYRIDKSRSGKENHAGLGLSLCARICELHNARFEIEDFSAIMDTSQGLVVVSGVLVFVTITLNAVVFVKYRKISAGK